MNGRNRSGSGGNVPSVNAFPIPMDLFVGKGPAVNPSHHAHNLVTIVILPMLDAMLVSLLIDIFCLGRLCNSRLKIGVK
jgi:hypothetical protein